MSDLIGAPLARPDAPGKTTGTTRYPADLVRPGMLHLAVIFAGRPHARILIVDITAAMATPGVVAVLTAADVPHNAYGLIEDDQPMLCDEVVRFDGDKVALVAAESAEAARLGAERVRVDYEDLPAVFDPETALAENAPLVHAERGSNLLAHVPIRRGDVEHGFAEADLVLDGEFSTNWQEHAYLQPDAGIAFPDEQGRIVVETAGQWLHEDRRQIAAMLGLPAEQVVIRYAAIGGAFGGREDLSVQGLLALAAWKLRRPVALVWSREESMIGHHKRHPMRIACRWGATRDGRITAVRARVVADGGAYASTSAEVLKVAALFSTGPYEVPNVAIDGYAVYTNNVPSGAFRGFGAPQAHFAAESMIARLAHGLGLDPIEFRRRNLYREGSTEPTGGALPEGVGIRAVVDAALAEAQARFDGPPIGDAPGHLRRGVGFACGYKNVGYSFGYPEKARATVQLHGRGEVTRAVVKVGAAEVGQGTHLALRQIAADALNVPFGVVELVAEDSSLAPDAGSASASRLTLMAGRAVHDAAKAALQRYVESEALEVEESVEYRPPATTALDPVTGAGRPNYCYGYAAQAVEVEVNTLTGQVRVLRVVSAHDVGKAINQQQVEGQIEGCVAQAIGYALLEHYQVDQGITRTPRFSTYLLPTALDVPAEIYPVVLELADPNGPYGARGVAEMALVPFAAAVADAIHDATGVWLSDLPMTPERVLSALTT